VDRAGAAVERSWRPALEREHLRRLDARHLATVVDPHVVVTWLDGVSAARRDPIDREPDDALVGVIAEQPVGRVVEGQVRHETVDQLVGRGGPVGLPEGLDNATVAETHPVHLVAPLERLQAELCDVPREERDHRPEIRLGPPHLSGRHAEDALVLGQREHPRAVEVARVVTDGVRGLDAPEPVEEAHVR
jgi:hypothetical protein